MANMNLPLRLKIIPARLYTSRLLSGWQEFFCYLAFQSRSEQAPTIDRMTWSLTDPMMCQPVLIDSHAMAEQNQASGWVAREEIR